MEETLPVVAEDEDGPEKGSLGDPIERPEEPAIKIHGGNGQSSDGTNVSGYVAHRSQRTFHPTMLRNRSPYVPDLKRRLCARIKPFFLPGTGIFVHIGALVHSNNHPGRERERFGGRFSLYNSKKRKCGNWNVVKKGFDVFCGL